MAIAGGTGTLGGAMVVLTLGLTATTAAMGQPYVGQQYMGHHSMGHHSMGHGAVGYDAVGHDHPWAPADNGPGPPRALEPALWAPAPGVPSGVFYGDAGGAPGFTSSGPYPAPFSGGLAPAARGGGYGSIPGTSPYAAPGFQPWTPDFPGAPNAANTRSGGEPGMGFWEVAPTAFRYRREPVTGGPRIYAHGWYTPWGDYEGVMVIRGNARDMFQGRGY